MGQIPLQREIIEYAFCDLDPRNDKDHKHSLKEALNQQHCIISGRKLRIAVRKAFPPNSPEIQEYFRTRRAKSSVQILTMLMLTIDPIYDVARKYISNARPYYTCQEIGRIFDLDPEEVSRKIYDSVRKRSSKIVVQLGNSEILRLTSNSQQGRSQSAWSLLRESTEKLRHERVNRMVFLLPKGVIALRDFLSRDFHQVHHTGLGAAAV